MFDYIDKVFIIKTIIIMVIYYLLTMLVTAFIMNRYTNLSENKKRIIPKLIRLILRTILFAPEILNSLARLYRILWKLTLLLIKKLSFNNIYNFFVSLYNMRIIDIFTFITRNSHVILLTIFLVSLGWFLISYELNNMKKKSVVSHATVKVDELASNAYRNLFRCLKHKDFQTLGEICEVDLIKKLQVVNHYMIPLYTDVNITKYDNKNGIISVICTGFFEDNSTSRHTLIFQRNKNNEYLVSDIGSAK